MTSVYEIKSVEDLRKNLSKILKEYEANSPEAQEIVITFHGRPVAVLSPYTETVYATWEEVFSFADPAGHIRAAFNVSETELPELGPAPGILRERVRKALPPGVDLIGNDFIGPARPRIPFDRDAIRAAIRGVAPTTETEI